MIARRLGVACGLALGAALAAAPAWPAVNVQVHLSRRQVTVGESVTLDVVVTGVSGGVNEPDLGLPEGLEVLASSRGPLSWVQAQGLGSVAFRYELSPSSAGQMRIGPVRVRVGAQVCTSEALDLEAIAAPREVAGRGSGVASLVAEVSPAAPYVGQMALLRVRLIQRAPLAEDPQYTPPATTGFWSERTSDPESYYAQQEGRRVLVTETRTRLYPLASGVATIGGASASLVLASENPQPGLFGGSSRGLTVRSPAIRVAVRPLPAGAPAGFDGAVGRLRVSWSADRDSSPRDVPFVVRLDVRGVGNLPLLKTPPLPAQDVEVFSSSLEDSLPAPGSVGDGRRRFQWTVLARRSGTLRVGAPTLRWFDPEANAYRSETPEPIAVEVGAAIGGATGAGSESFPEVFVRHPADPTATPARAWALALAGALLGGAASLWRRSRPTVQDSAVAAQQREWLRAVGLARGPEFWDAADRAAAWLAHEGRPVGSVPREIAAARYGGRAPDEDRIRRRLVELLSGSLERSGERLALRLGAGALLAAVVALAFLFGPHAGGEGERIRARRADERARLGDLADARAEWLALWRMGRAPALAARLAWLEIRRGAVGEAAAWVVRGDAEEPRDPALADIAGRVGEAGGLTGERRERLPVRSVEWGALAGLLAGLGVASRRRARIGVLLALAVLVAAGPNLERALDGGGERGALLRSTRLEGGDVELEPGQVVRILGRESGRIHIRVGDLDGWVSGDTVAGAGAAS